MHGIKEDGRGKRAVNVAARRQQGALLDYVLSAVVE
jgi:hypothetical protein